MSGLGTVTFNYSQRLYKCPQSITTSHLHVIRPFSDNNFFYGCFVKGLPLPHTVMLFASIIFFQEHWLQYHEGNFSLLTCVWLPTTVRSSRGGSVSCLHLQSESTFRLPVKDLLRENLPGLRVDLEAVLALVPDAVYDVVVHLVVGECPVLVDCIYPVEQIRMKMHL